MKPRFPKRVILILASALAPVLLAGCGGGNGGPSNVPNVPAPGGAYGLQGQLTFRNATSGGSFDAPPLAIFDDLSDQGFLRTLTTDEGILQFARFSGKRSAFGPTKRTLDVGIGLNSVEDDERPYVPFVVGRSYPLKPQGFSSLYVDGVRFDLGDGLIYQSVAGQIKVLAVGPDSLTLRLDNVRMETLRAASFDSVTVNGTLSVGGLASFSLRTKAAAQ